MRPAIPSVPSVMTGVLGIFMLTASFGTMIPGFVHDRVPKQFVPTCHWLVSHVVETPSEDLVMVLARISQVIIAGVELIAGLAMLAATFLPAKRLVLTNFGVGLCMGLFGAFMLTMFAMHDKSLPAWNQYPAILAWLGATWLVVSLTDGQARGMKHGS